MLTWQYVLSDSLRCALYLTTETISFPSGIKSYNGWIINNKSSHTAPPIGKALLLCMVNLYNFPYMRIIVHIINHKLPFDIILQRANVFQKFVLRYFYMNAMEKLWCLKVLLEGSVLCRHTESCDQWINCLMWHTFFIFQIKFQKRDQCNWIGGNYYF